MTPFAGPLLIAVAVAAGGGQCGPSNRDVGEAILLVWPLVALLALGPQIALLALWRKARPEVDLHLKRFFILIGAAVTVAYPTMLAAQQPWRWADAALWMFGASYGTVLLLTTRIWLSSNEKTALIGPHLVATVIFIPFAALLYTRVLHHGELADLFILPGYGGFTTGPLFLILLIEVLVRRRRATSDSLLV